MNEQTMRRTTEEAELVRSALNSHDDYALGSVTTTEWSAGFIAINLASGRSLSITITEVSA